MHWCVYKPTGGGLLNIKDELAHLEAPSDLKENMERETYLVGWSQVNFNII